MPSSSNLIIGYAVSSNTGMLIVLPFLARFAGVEAVTCGSGTIADLMPVEKRGKAMGFWALGSIFWSYYWTC
jgi:MFS family permease